MAERLKGAVRDGVYVRTAPLKMLLLRIFSIVQTKL